MNVTQCNSGAAAGDVLHKRHQVFQCTNRSVSVSYRQETMLPSFCSWFEVLSVPRNSQRSIFVVLFFQLQVRATSLQLQVGSGECSRYACRGNRIGVHVDGQCVLRFFSDIKHFFGSIRVHALVPQ